MEYEDRLKALGIWSLEERRNRADLLEVFKMKSGFSAVSFDAFFTVDSQQRTRGHSWKIVKHRSGTFGYTSSQSGLLIDGTNWIKETLTVEVLTVSRTD